MSDLFYKDESYKIIGACYNVYNEIGNGFLEAVYQECLELEFQKAGIPYESQKELTIIYKEQKLKSKYKPDFVCYNDVIIEIKAATGLCDEFRAQLINYLKITGIKLGILVNFGCHPKMQYERFVL